MPAARRPPSRKDYRIAAICALPAESEAVEAMFDENWEKEQRYPRLERDPNAYSMGRIGVHNIVLAFMPGMGKSNSSSMVAHLLHSFPRIELGLVVGICGGVPFIRESPYVPRDIEVFLGDVIISTAVVQYDFGRQYPDQLVRMLAVQDTLGRPNNTIRSFVHKMQRLQGRKFIESESSNFLANLLQQKGFEKSRYPGADKDILYKAAYRHKHHDPTTCICASCENKEDKVCDIALNASCDDLKCDLKNQVRRDRLDKLRENPTYHSAPSKEEGARTPSSLIHFGLVASGDSVMKSAYHRDELASKEEVIGYEMEGAGAWEGVQTVVIKGVVDYSDSHKSYLWRNYGAACAAACCKAFVNEWRPTEESPQFEAGSNMLTVVKQGAPGLTKRHIHESTGGMRGDFETQSELEEIGKEVNKAYLLLHRRNEASMKDDLEAALRILSEAEVRSRDLDSSSLQRIFFGLMVVEKELSCYRGFQITEQMKHVKEAQRYGTKLQNIVSRFSSDSLRAQVSLEQHILRGRKAILDSEGGKNIEDVKRSKSEAIRGIEKALDELQAVDPVSFNEVYKAAHVWRDHFGDTSQ